MTKASRLIRRAVLSFIVAAFAMPVAAQDKTVGASVAGAGTAPTAVMQNDLRESVSGTSSLLEDQRAGRRAPPFGSQLFASGAAPVNTTVMDPSYVIRPGDRIAVTLYGLVNQSQEVVVDPRGNIILPQIGPVQVAGATAGSVTSSVQAAVSRVYQDSVYVYAAPVGAGEIQVFAAGGVVKPGPQPGSGNDTVISFLQRAGGIDPARGSYRRIEVRRAKRVIGKIDLYAFITEGLLPDIQLRKDDVVVVGQQGPVVSVTGVARAPFTFEFANSTGTGSEILRFARPRPEVTHVSLLGTRDGQPYNAYVSRAEFASMVLLDGDRVRFEADAPSPTFIVRIDGAQSGPSAYTVSRGETLGNLLKRVPIDRYADQAMIHLRRTSVAATQKQLLEESLARLEKAIYTTPAPTAGVAQARQMDNAGLQQFIQRARGVVPSGVVALPEDADLDRLLLEPDDVIVIPYQSQTVTVAGEVELPQTLIWTPGGTAATYVKRAGGFAARANRAQTLVIHPDGSSERGGPVRPGDRILVPPKISGQFIELVKDLTQILFQTGVAALAIFDRNN